MVYALSDLSAQLASALDTTPKNVKRKHPDIAPRHLEAFEGEIAVTRNAAVDLADRIPRLLDDYLATLDESAG